MGVTMGKAGDDALHDRLERAIVALLAKRQGTICPSEAARAVDPSSWRDLMEATRLAARNLAARGVIVVLKRGAPVDAVAVRGPVRYGRGPAFGEN